jgi:electron transport complex protein RnfG
MSKQAETETATAANDTAKAIRQGIAALILIAALTGLTIYAIHRITAPRIAENLTAQAMQTINQVLPAGIYDNQPQTDIYLASSRTLLGSSSPLPAYRARLGSSAVAVVLTTEAPDGYVGPIRLLIAIDRDGNIIGLRALQHQETPGLGDKIDADKSNWLQQFVGVSPNESVAELGLSSDGGRIDHISGATITSRSVTKAVRNTLLYFVENQQALLAPAASPEATTTR